MCPSLRGLVSSALEPEGPLTPFISIRRLSWKALGGHPLDSEDWKSFLDALPDPWVACDSEERIEGASLSAETLLGWSPNGLDGQKLTSILPPRIHEVGGLPFAHYVRGRTKALTGRSLRTTLLRRDGTEIDMDCTAGSSRGPRRGERILLCFRRLPEALDFTDEPLERLSRPTPPKLERFYQLVFENAPMGLIHFNGSGVITACNDKFVQIIGSSKRLIVGLRLLSLKSPAILGCITEALAGRTGFYEGEYVSATAQKHSHVRCHFAPCQEGGVGIIEDLSEQYRAERTQIHTTGMLDLLFKHSPLGLAFLDPALQCVLVNDQLAALLGRSPEEMKGLSLKELLPVGGSETAESNLKRILQGGVPLVKVETPGARFGPGASGRTLEFSVYPVKSAEGEVLGLGTIAEDITERKRAQEDIQRMYQEAQEAVQVRNDFLSIASHELKTPLTPLFLWLTAMERRLERGEHVNADFLRPAHKQMVRLTGLINDLLDVSRIESGALGITLAPLQLGPFLAGIAKEYPGNDHRRVVLGPLEDALWVGADAHRLEQVVVNLIENALKYSPEGGDVTVDLEVRDKLAVLSVQDLGIGIPKDQQSKLFERFFRARNVSDRSFGGLGLGLYICQDIVARHGGSIRVESEVGRGSTFRVALPLLQGRVRALPEEQRAL